MSTGTVANDLRWDVSSIFPSLESYEFSSEFSAVMAAIDELESTFQANGIEGGEALVANDQLITMLREMIERSNQLLARVRLLRSYIYCFVSTDSTDPVALAKQSEFAVPATKLSKLTSSFTAWVGRFSDPDKLCQDHRLEGYSYPIYKLITRSKMLFPRGEEELLADLADTGLSSWGRLYSNYTSQIEVPWDGGTVPMSKIRNFAYESDGNIRKKAYEAELGSWKQNELTLTSCMNSIKGQTSLVAKKRGWSELLDESLFAANIERPALEAMYEAVHESFPDFRRYFQAKAKYLGHQGGLPFYDLFAPVGSESAWPYEQGKEFVIEKFGEYSSKLSGLAERAFQENWVDVYPRAGKEGGAFCTGLRGGESRILMNYKPTFGSVSTLAHELGHAFHNLCLAERTEMQKSTPMTLAETASIFCETIIKKSALPQTTGEDRLSLLDASLQGISQVVVDVTSRFIFEKEVIKKREARELNSEEICEIMKDAQMQTYGDGLDSNYFHPYMWAAKPHYYSQRAFYNFPYTFGLLFGLGLYAVYESDRNSFKDRYELLLSSTGLAPAQELANDFGIDILDAEFWRGSIRTIKTDIDEFVSSVG